ncbi:hypothetical protein [Thalassotalea hakodatensis]|uniref:hypothetical protein n=1 Tax=Thalassotalea hakodatensis TaxID=3030492 RepID=UPI002573442E|nr:hypothetical protein [Thalassotalea hakodatensis]
MSLKHGLISSLAIITLLGAILAGVILNQPNQIKIINNSTQIITNASVAVGGEEYTFEKIESNSAQSLWYFYNGVDSEFDVYIYFENGQTTRMVGGYMTSGIFFNTTIVNVSPKLELTLATE